MRATAIEQRLFGGGRAHWHAPTKTAVVLRYFSAILNDSNCAPSAT